MKRKKFKITGKELIDAGVTGYGYYIEGDFKEITHFSASSLASKSHRKEDIPDTKYSFTEDNLNKLIKL